MRDEIPPSAKQPHDMKKKKKKSTPGREARTLCGRRLGQASIDANQLFQLLDTIAKAVSF